MQHLKKKHQEKKPEEKNDIKRVPFPPKNSHPRHQVQKLQIRINRHLFDRRYIFRCIIRSTRQNHQTPPKAVLKTQFRNAETALTPSPPHPPIQSNNQKNWIETTPLSLSSNCSRLVSFLSNKIFFHLISVTNFPFCLLICSWRMSWFRSAVIRVMEAGGKNNLTRTVRNYAENVTNAVSEGAKILQDRIVISLSLLSIYPLSALIETGSL